MRMARLWWRVQVRSSGDDADRLAAQVLAGGADIVSARPGPDDEHEAAVLARLRAAAAPTHALVVASGTPAVAARAHADALLLADGQPAAGARALLHRWAHLGRTVHSRAEVDAALADTDLDFLVVSAGPACTGDLDLVRYAARRAPAYELDAKPWWAVGAFDPDTAETVLAAGACRLLVDEATPSPLDRRAAAEALRVAISRPWQRPAMQRYLTGAAAGTSSLVRG